MKTNHLILLLSVALAAVSVAADVRPSRQQAILADDNLADAQSVEPEVATEPVKTGNWIVIERKPAVGLSAPPGASSEFDAETTDGPDGPDAHEHQPSVDAGPVVEVEPLTQEEADRAIQDAHADQGAGLRGASTPGNNNGEEEEEKEGSDTMSADYVYDPTKKSSLGYDDDGRQQVVNVGPGLVSTADGNTRARGGGPHGLQRGSIVPNEYIVVLKPEADIEAFDIHGRVEQYNRLLRRPPRGHSRVDPGSEGSDNESEEVLENKVVHEYDFGSWKGYAGRFTAEFIKDLEEHEAVDYVEEDRVMWAWGMPARSNQDYIVSDDDNNNDDDDDDFYDIGAAEAAKRTTQRIKEFFDERLKQLKQQQQQQQQQQQEEEEEHEVVIQEITDEEAENLERQGPQVKVIGPNTSEEELDVHPGSSEAADWQLQPVQPTQHDIDLGAEVAANGDGGTSSGKGARHGVPQPGHQEQAQDSVTETWSVHTPSWGLVRISERRPNSAREYSYASTAGAGVDVYTIDSGVYADHEDFEGRASVLKNYILTEKDTDTAGH
ncbi:Transcriptional coactivator, partial [Actinomortierella ambigua]